jgi:hypothetical protein
VLADLAARAPALPPAERAIAAALLARPTDGSQTGQRGGPYTVPAVSAYSDHFCFHWVTTTADEPSLADGNGDAFPDYVEELADVFETSCRRQHAATTEGGLWWREPISDGTRGGWTGR